MFIIMDCDLEAFVDDRRTEVEEDVDYSGVASRDSMANGADHMDDDEDDAGGW